MIVEKSAIEEERKRLKTEYEEEYKMYLANQRDAYPGESSDDGRTGPEAGRICDCGFLTYCKTAYRGHFYQAHHKSWKKRKTNNIYMF